MSMRMIVLGASVIAAGGSGYLAMNISSPAPPVQVAASAPSAPAIEIERVLVASRDLVVGDVLDGQTRWQEWPTSAVGPQYITQSNRPTAQSELQGSVVRSTFSSGEPIRASKLLGADQSFMSSILPSGKRAVATEIAADTSAGGFILPDDYVDVIMTSRTTGTGTLPSTETILNNIRVLAIDQTIREDEQGRLVQVGRTATLELTPKQAEVITAAQQIADRLTLALRSVQDVNEEDALISADHLISGGASNAITVIKGTNTTTVQTR